MRNPQHGPRRSIDMDTLCRSNLGCEAEFGSIDLEGVMHVVLT